MLSVAILTLMVIPAAYQLWKERHLASVSQAKR
jgi:hypothetical protein